jgi:hypothetical protein
MHTPGPRFTIIARPYHSIPGAGRAKRNCYCVYRDSQYIARYYRRRDAEAAIARARGES